jgi:predicted ribosome quality control (RQC) complex YloA/Tae2 family protein
LSPNGIEERKNIRTIVREKLFDNENNPYSTQNRRNTEESMKQKRILEKELEKEVKNELEKEFILENEDREEKKLEKKLEKIQKRIEKLTKRSRGLRRNNYKSKGGKTRRHKIRLSTPVKFSR